jgi:steroid 5-alpha reductase family enzyme
MGAVAGLWLGGLVLLVVMMVMLWAVSLAIHNAAVVDIGWGAAMALLALLYFVFGDGYLPRRALVCGMVALWGLRLAVYLAVTRVIGQPEEGRYRTLRAEWGDAAERKFLTFFQFQAVTAAVLSIAWLLPSVNPAPGISALEWLAAALWLVGFVGEWAADAQLQAFKADRSKKGQVCRKGLWNLSRHPNYFFEFVMWAAIGLFATASPHGWVAWVSPAAIAFFLFRVTGIPATEAQALKSRGDAYRDYQQTTSAFVPWFPRTHAPID